MCYILCEDVCKFKCEVIIMATNLAIDDTLILQAKKLGHHKTKKAAVTQALQQYIKYMKQLQIVKLFGKIEIASDYDYKQQRKIT